MIRWSADDEWELCGQNSDFGWVQIAEPVMKLYTESTDGSSIETKESALVWHHRDADPGFGSCQSMELLDHLESVLANEPVTVKSGQYIVEVKPQVSILILLIVIFELCCIICHFIAHSLTHLYNLARILVINRKIYCQNLCPNHFGIYYDLKILMSRCSVEI